MEGGDFCKDKNSCIIGVAIGIVITLLLVVLYTKYVKKDDKTTTTPKAERCINSPLISVANGGCPRERMSDWKIPPLGERFQAGSGQLNTPY